MQNFRFSALLLLSTLSVQLLTLPTAQAGLKKWVDEHGQVHYGDRVPSKYMTSDHSTLNEQGVVVRTKRYKTEEEIAEEERIRAEKNEETRKRLIEERKQALRDRVLTDTFTTERDIKISHKARIEALDSQILLAETLIKHDEQRLTDAKERIKSIEARGREAPKNLHNDVTAISRQLEINFAYVEDRQNERKEINAQFERDIKRFRELMKEKHEAKMKKQKSKN